MNLRIVYEYIDSPQMQESGTRPAHHKSFFYFMSLDVSYQVVQVILNTKCNNLPGDKSD